MLNINNKVVVCEHVGWHIEFPWHCRIRLFNGSFVIDLTSGLSNRGPELMLLFCRWTLYHLQLYSDVRIHARIIAKKIPYNHSIWDMALNISSVRDTKWLTLEVCRQFQRGNCSRSNEECKFAHPPKSCQVESGRVIACFDSLKVRRGANTVSTCKSFLYSMDVGVGWYRLVLIIYSESYQDLPS